MTLLLKLVFLALASKGKSNSIEILRNEVPPFICIDGAEISFTNVCDGLPHCADSSDETTNLCRHIVCPVRKFKCAYGACISRDSRCNGFVDCVDGSDESFCDQDSDCSDERFRCPTSLECIASVRICNGFQDCVDGGDENVEICEDFACPEHTFQCSYGGCIHQEVVCDGIKDCVDGTDEDENLCAAANCQGEDCRRYRCRDDEFSCQKVRQCIPLSRLCDGTHQCRDASDEKSETCKERTCAAGYFRCNYGGCVPASLRCNGQANCHDWSDEDENTCGFVALPEGACRLPAALPGTHYVVKEGCEQCRPGDVAPELTRLDYSCHGTHSHLEGPNSVHCQANRWLPSLPICLDADDSIKCPSIMAPGTIKSCEVMWGSEAGWTSCENAVPIGTRQFMDCRDYYERETGSSHITCLHDGTWNQVPLSCKPICGVRSTTSTALIVKGWEATAEETFPWHSTLFSHENGSWNFFCGGTLIAESIVLTAGHCVWKTDPLTIRVVLASRTSNFTNQAEHSQVRDIERIVLQNAYYDHEGNYGSDLALLILKEPASINDYVLPACIDWSNRYNINRRTGENGLITGMGITENDTFSATLRLVSAQIVTDSECHAKSTRDFRKYLTYTSFCAGWANGTGVCNGDSGGGFILKRPNSTLWDIHGVVSLSPRRSGGNFCDPNYYTVFTRLSAYLDWIKTVVQSIAVSEAMISTAVSLPNKDDIELN